jgi:transglutaminase-like putative cysteine protease
VAGQDASSVPLQAFLASTTTTKANAAIEALARQHQGSDRLEQLHRLSASVLKRVDYVIGATHAHTSAAEALRDGQGVCQDHAHVFISAARLMGAPARYVSGYLVVNENELAEASHAWAEAHVDGLGWVGFDVSNQVSPDERYIKVAVGMDARGAAPVNGIRRGASSGNEEMAVEVLVEQVVPQ